MMRSLPYTVLNHQKCIFVYLLSIAGTNKSFTFHSYHLPNEFPSPSGHRTRAYLKGGSDGDGGGGSGRHNGIGLKLNETKLDLVHLIKIYQDNGIGLLILFASTV